MPAIIKNIINIVFTLAIILYGISRSRKSIVPVNWPGLISNLFIKEL